MRYKAKEQQNVFDVIIQNTGSLENAYDVLKRNKLTVNSFVGLGSEIEIESSDVDDENREGYFRLKNINVANGQGFGGDYSNDYSKDYSIK